MLEAVRLEPSGEWPGGLACWCFLHLSQGTGYWLGQHEVTELSAGDVWVLPPQGIGVFRASQISEATLRYFVLCPELLGGLFTLSELKHLRTIARRHQDRVQRLAREDAVASELGRMEPLAAGADGFLHRCRILGVAADYFAREWRSPRSSNPSFVPAKQRIKRLIQELTGTEILSCSVAELAARCNCSPRHFHRLFHQNVGVSWSLKQVELRLMKARQMLVESDATVTAIAHAVGYRTLAVFDTAFRKQFSVSPSEWRENPRSGAARLPSPARELLVTGK